MLNIITSHLLAIKQNQQEIKNSPAPQNQVGAVHKNIAESDQIGALPPREDDEENP